MKSVNTAKKEVVREVIALAPELPAPELKEVAKATASESIPQPTPQSTPQPAPQSTGSEIVGIVSVSLYTFWQVIRLTFRTIFCYLRYHPIHALLNLLFIIGLALVIVTGSEIHKQLILSRISDQTLDKIIEGSKFTRDFDSLAANREGGREFFGVGAPDWIQKESIRAILYHARKADLSIEDLAVLLATADVESGFNPLARAPTTSACGLFQFVQRTGEMFKLSQEECMDPWLNARSGVQHYIQNFENRVRTKVDHLQGAERVFKSFELSYYLHHDGPASSNPSTEVKAIVLGGSEFLFAAYRVLQDEAESEKKAPTFAQIFSQNLMKLLDDAYTFFVPSANASVPAISEPEQRK